MPLAKNDDLHIHIKVEGLGFLSKQPADVDVNNLAKLLLSEVRMLLASETIKEWYSTDDLATALGKAPFTVREKWCNEGRIECEKDENGKWRIPGHEYRRLTEGGAIRSKRRHS